MKTKAIAGAALLAVGLSAQVQAAPVDIAFIIDQSVSMRPEFAFIPGAISQIDTGLSGAAGVDSVRYGVVGYMESPQIRDNGTTNLVYQDLTSSVNNVVSLVDPIPPLYASQESGYEAAYWSQTGFSWDQNAAKIMILLTDESGDQRSDLGPNAPAIGAAGREQWLGVELDSNNFLLNVITRTNLYSQWDEAVFDINDSSYQGLFSLDDLRNDVAAFTAAFAAAKVNEILDNLPPDQGPGPSPGQSTVPEPSGLLLLGAALLGLLRRRRR